MIVRKRNNSTEEFNIEKISSAIYKAKAEQDFIPFALIESAFKYGKEVKEISIENIQDDVEFFLMSNGFYQTAKNYIKYREKHKEARFIKERIAYMEKYSRSHDNAATSSETDANANVTMKNVANLEGEVYKTTNRIIQRARMKDKLNEMFPEVAKQYEKDLNHHILYS